LKGKSALITGASSGLGETFAHALAARGMALLLVARSGDRLRAAAAELAAQHGVRIEVVVMDLAERDAPRRLQHTADALGFEPDLLVNNAGLGVLGPFADTALDRQLETIRVNVEALVALTGLYVPRMLARRSGAILNVASTTGLRPVPNFAVYAASKAFVVSFSEALWVECRNRGVRVLAVCPGVVSNTQFRVRAGSRPAPKHGMSREAVVAQALRALDHDQPIAVIGLSNRLGALTWAVMPRRLRLVVSERLFRRAQARSSVAW
jgi:short-subunit dehydrogenase